MSRPRKKKALDKGREARRVARKSGLKAGATKIVPDKRKMPPKHKADLVPAADE
jgi:hypothetical protein